MCGFNDIRLCCLLDGQLLKYACKHKIGLCVCVGGGGGGIRDAGDRPHFVAGTKILAYFFTKNLVIPPPLQCDQSQPLFVKSRQSFL